MAEVERETDHTLSARWCVCNTEQADSPLPPNLEMGAEFVYRGRILRVDNIVPYNNGGCDATFKVVE